MKHDDIRHRLSEYIDGSVTGEDRAEIDAHLKTCTQCSEALLELRKTIGHIKDIEEIDPPAWMTRKIMATVRAEAEEKKGFFHRFFFPLRIKLPIQAVAVLFLAITAFYINQRTQPASEHTETPIQEFAARNEIPPIGTAQDKLAKADGPATRSKQVPQTPAYKTLDMKLEYEKPAKPSPQDQAAAPAHSPAKPAEESALVKHEGVSDKNDAEPQPATPSLMREQAKPSTEAALQTEGKKGSSALRRKVKGAAADDGTGSMISITLSVKDIETAVENIEAMIRQFEGTIISTMRLDANRKYIISLSSHHANDLIVKLKLVGDMKEKNLVLESREGRMLFSIELDRVQMPAAEE